MILRLSVSSKCGFVSKTISTSEEAHYKKKLHLAVLRKQLSREFQVFHHNAFMAPFNTICEITFTTKGEKSPFFPHNSVHLE